ncbi:glycosyltransferase family 2 protein [Sphingobacterium sp. UDSM-2020]|uniref:glycosyltransferase family 2 protein n=1 Tax=Sphingobacterium sp. UDSM-2020 TaxID=2795738 RepID=UPI0019372A43|nr:glycosyltransferase family 2 protein [Sphingobacterium sp. UDSM-2020]QQD15321.1 glycosyltransferase [Sphingobacterium sp. UDSM-2020]
MYNNPTFSIITVVYNNVRDIEHTLKSVVSQTYKHVEYIVIDGLSTDGTLDVIEKYRPQVSVILSEKDNGIYDAMNKGLALATGDYVLFLNSGDELYSKETLANLAEVSEGADIIYGETFLINEQREIIGERRHKVPAYFNWKSFRYGMNICHQAIYIKRTIAEPYDLQYKLCADIDWVIKAAKKSSITVNAHQHVARYLVGGMSKQRHRESLKERYDIFQKYYGRIPNLFNHFIIALKMIVYRIKNGNPED